MPHINTEEPRSDITITAAEVVAAYVANNSVPAIELPSLIKAVVQAFNDLQPGVVTTEVVKPEPAVPVKKSIHRDYLISLEDGKRYQTLRRHLSVLGMTPDQYRAKWGLPANYPMTAAAYSERRSALARSFGLGRKPKAAEVVPNAPKRVRAKPQQGAVPQTADDGAEQAQEAA